MTELPTYVAMAPEEFLIHRSNGVVSMGSIVDSIRQPGVVGMYNRKPVFLFINAAEKTALESGNIELYSSLRGFKTQFLTNSDPKLPKT